MKHLLRNWVLAFVAPRPLVGILHLPRYLRDWWRYRNLSEGTPRSTFADSYPCLVDWTPSTPFDPHYFHQGAWLARRLAAASPSLHVDVGSSVMMLSVMTAWCPTLFVDVRPLQARLSGLLPVAGTLLRLPFADGALRSLSCLHVIEHVGLGRYGDQVDPDGARLAAAELQRVLAPGGHLHLSVPVGRERVCFNAHRVFDPRTILAWFGACDLDAFMLVDDQGALHAAADPAAAAGLEYGCGMFALRKR
ncbi:MAG: DUF268 domain-containing protein [Burkholderiales bacterium]